MTKGEHTNVRTGQTLYPFVVRGDNKEHRGRKILNKE